MQQVDRRNHPAAHTVERFKWLQSGPGALAPEPDAEGGIFARGASGGIDRMIPECLEGIAHHFQQQRRVLPLGEMAANRAAGDIVRRGLGAAGFRIAQHQTVAIAHTGIKFNLAAAEFFLHHGNELGGLPARNFPCAVIEHRLILERGLIRKGDEVAAVGHVVRPELYPQADRFKRGTPGIAAGRIDADRRQVRHIAAGRHVLRNGNRHSHHAVRGDPVHIGVACGFQRSAAFKLLKGFVGHPVPQKYDIFQNSFLPVKK